MVCAKGVCCAVVLFGVIGALLVEAKTINVTTTKGMRAKLDFKTYFPGYVGVVVFVDSLPARGRLYEAHNLQSLRPVNSSGTTFSYSQFLYLPEDKFAVGNAYDTFNFSIADDDHPNGEKGIVILNILNTPPVAHSTTFYTVDSHDRVVNLFVTDADAISTRQQEVANITIVQTPENQTCTLYQMDGELIKAGSTVHDTAKWRVRVVPPPSFSAGSSCSFAYMGYDVDGAASNIATIRLKSRVPPPPRARSTTARVRFGLDPSRTIELLGTSETSQNLTFVITALPKYGAVYDTKETGMSTLPPPLTMDKGDIVLYQGPYSRVVLVYLPPKVLPNDVGANERVSYFVKDDYGASPIANITIIVAKPRQPVCGLTLVANAFADRPSRRIRLNYSDPDGFPFQRLDLLSMWPTNIGRLYRTHANLTLSMINIGDHFTDLQHGLVWSALDPTRDRSAIDFFSYRAVTMEGLSCVGTIRVEVMAHDQNASGAPYQVRVERVRSGSINLLLLCGYANASIPNVTSVEILVGPKIGSLYGMSSEAPYEPGTTYRWNIETNPYCERHNCTKYLTEKLESHSVYTGVDLWSRSNLDNSGSKFYALYVGPPTGHGFSGSDDIIEFVYRNDQNQTSVRQQLHLHIVRGKLRQIIFTYKNKPRGDNFGRQVENWVVCQLNRENPKQEVAVMEANMLRRHGQAPFFRLFQAVRSGFDYFPGDILRDYQVSGITGMWAQNGTVILVPGARARKMNFEFRGRLYNRKEDGTLDPDFEEVRYLVQRENSPPRWDNDNERNLTVEAGELRKIVLTATDDDDDRLIFILTKAPRYGYLLFETTRFGQTTASIVSKGSHMATPKGSDLRSVLILHYKCSGDPRWTYPVSDSFAVVADDYSGTLSPDLVVDIAITKGTVKFAVIVAPAKPNPTVAIIGVFGFITLLIVITVVLVRRRARHRYMTVPQTQVVVPPTEMQQT